MILITPGATSYSALVTVDFGFASGGEGDTVITTVTAPWVKSSSNITCLVQLVDTADHNAEEALIEGIVAYATNIIPGVGFDIWACANNNTWGRYQIKAIGV